MMIFFMRHVFYDPFMILKDNCDLVCGWEDRVFSQSESKDEADKLGLEDTIFVLFSKLLGDGMAVVGTPCCCCGILAIYARSV